MYMPEIFLTSDMHFCHNKEFLYKPRGFSSVEEMNEIIIENWNKTVGEHDTVYVLGDIMLNDDDKGIECMQRLNGEFFIIWGNHDSDKRKDRLFRECRYMNGGWYAWNFKYNNKYSIYLSHYPTITSNFDQKKFSQHVLSLHGHVHSKTNWIIPTNPFLYHVGMDSHNCTPVNLDEILSDVRQRWEEIGKLPQLVRPEDTYPYEKNLF